MHLYSSPTPSTLQNGLNLFFEGVSLSQTFIFTNIIFIFILSYCQNLWQYFIISLSCWNISSELCNTAPSENILSHYIPAAGGMNALWPKLSTSSERIFIKYIWIVIKNGSENSSRCICPRIATREAVNFPFSFTQ